MAIKTISLEIDAYEKLKQAKRGSESFSQVVRRARFDLEESTGASILKETQALYDSGGGLSDQELATLEKLEAENRKKPRISPNKWDLS